MFLDDYRGLHDEGLRLPNELVLIKFLDAIEIFIFLVMFDLWGISSV